MRLDILSPNPPTGGSLLPVVVLLVSLLTYLGIRFLFDPLHHVPGPLLAKFTNLWYARQTHLGTFHQTNIKLHQMHGPLVRIGPNQYSIDDPASVKTLYGAGSKFVKGDWYYASTSPAFEHLNLFALRDSKKHSDLRRKLSRFYTMSNVLNYEEFVDRNLAIFCDRMQELARIGQDFDFGHWLQCLAFDVITDMTFARPFGFLDKGEDIDDLISSLEKVQRYSSVVGIFPNIHHILSGILGYDVAAVIPRFTIKHIQKRETLGPPDNSTSSRDFLSIFLDMIENSDAFGEFSGEHIIASCATNVTAGSDTTGISLSSAFYYLAKHPESAMKILSEINSVYPNRVKSQFLTFKETQELPYLQAVIKEALRLHPATGLPLARKVPKGGVSILGTYFPEGATVGINPWVAHNNQAVFGEDAHSYRPERWIEADPDVVARMERYWIPFGSGSRTCIGKNISILEISKVIPGILERFDIHLVESSEQEFFSTKCDWFVKPEALRVVLKCRE